MKMEDMANFAHSDVSEEKTEEVEKIDAPASPGKRKPLLPQGGSRTSITPELINELKQQIQGKSPNS